MLDAAKRNVRFIAIVLGLSVVNVGLLTAPQPLAAAEGDSGKSGVCVNGERVECFDCSGLCWKCGAAC